MDTDRRDGSTSPTKQRVVNTLRAGDVQSKIESLFAQAFCHYRRTKTVNIDYANEYLVRCMESEIGMLALFMVDDLLETLNLDATRAVFGAECGFKLNEVRDGDLIKQMYRMAEDVKLLDTVAEKMVCWYWNRASLIHQCIEMKMITWKIWTKLNLGEYMLIYKQMFEGFPGDDSREYYNSTSLHLLLHKCDPDARASVMEYTIQRKNPHFKKPATPSKLVDDRSSRRRSTSRSRKTSKSEYKQPPQVKSPRDPCEHFRRNSQVIDLTRHKSCDSDWGHLAPKQERMKRHSKF